MFRSLPILLLLTPFFLGARPASDPAAPAQVEFQTSIEIALAEAGESGKLVLVEFYASWCHPCRWMEATTFRDPDVIALMERQFVPLKADIDKKEGFRLFEQFGVEVLPTTLVLDRQGKVIARSEEAMSAAQLIDLLANLDQAGLEPSNHATPTAPASAATASPVAVQPEEAKSLKSETPEAEHPASALKQELTSPPAQGFSVQVGVFTLEANMLAKVRELRNVGEQPSWVQRSGEGPSALCKLLSGQFATRSEAEAWRAQLAAAGIPGYIRDLAAP